MASALSGGGITSKVDVTYLNFFLKEFNAVSHYKGDWLVSWAVRLEITQRFVVILGEHWRFGTHRGARTGYKKPVVSWVACGNHELFLACWHFDTHYRGVPPGCKPSCSGVERGMSGQFPVGCCCWSCCCCCCFVFSNTCRTRWVSSVYLISSV